MITILTPTYNRSKTLPTLFDSLLAQTSFDFEWIIIDDGSSDQTLDIVNSFKADKFPIKYFQKPNGGKHTALNYSHPYINGNLTFIVDSDDILTPDAISTIKADWRKYEDNPKIGVLSYTRMYNNGDTISQGDSKDYYIDNDISYRVNQNIGGDRCEILRTDLFKKYPLPVFENERFVSEGILWRNVALECDTVYIRKSIYITEYLPDGLSKSGRLFRMNNPYGMMANCISYMIPQVCWRVKVKQILAFGTYGFCAKLTPFEIVKKSKFKILQFVFLPASCILFRHWSKIYGFNK